MYISLNKLHFTLILIESYIYAALFEKHPFFKRNTHVEWSNEQAEKQHRMFKYWNMVLHLVLCALNIVKAMRGGNVHEYVASLLCLIPWFPLIIRIM